MITFVNLSFVCQVIHLSSNPSLIVATSCVFISASATNTHVSFLSSKSPIEKTGTEDKVQHSAVTLFSAVFLKAILSWPWERRFWKSAPFPPHNFFSTTQFVFIVHSRLWGCRSKFSVQCVRSNYVACLDKDNCFLTTACSMVVCAEPEGWGVLARRSARWREPYRESVSVHSSNDSSPSKNTSWRDTAAFLRGVTSKNVCQKKQVGLWWSRKRAFLLEIIDCSSHHNYKMTIYWDPRCKHFFF